MNKKAMGQIAAVNKLVACACAATSILLLARPVFADGCLQRNMPGSPDSEASSPCGCPTAGKDSAEVKDDCIKIVLGVGETTPWTGSRDVALKVFADDESPMVFTPYSLYAICGYTFKRIGNAVMADGSTPKEVVFSHPNGEPVKFVFAEGESLGRPDPGVHVPMDERLQMVDAEGWATAHDPVYWDLYMEDGRVRRYVATDMNGERGRFVSETDPHGRVVTPEDMGLDIVYDLNGVRQLLTPSRLADVQAFSNGYDVCVYAIQDVPARDAATGLYSVPSSAPYRVLTVRGENGGKRAVVTLKTGESEARTYIFDYVMGDWSLKRPNGVEERKERIVVDGRAAFLSKTVVSPSGERLARSEMNYKWESWGFAMTNKVEGFGSTTRTTSWTFWTSGGGKGKLKTRLEQSGLLTSYDYDGQGRKAAETRSGPDMMTEVTTYDYMPVDPSDPVLPVDTRPRTIVRKLNNIECERTYYVYSPLTNIVERVGTQGAAYGGTNVLRTVTAFYPVVANDARSGFVASIRYEDGKLDVYDYSLVSNLWVETITHLHEQSPAPVSGKTTRDITTTNRRGEVIEEKTEAFIDGIWYTIAKNQMTYNFEGKRITSESLAGQVTTTAWDCCRKVSEVQPDGSTTTWDYDDEGRMIASSRLIPLDMTNVTWLTTCYEYDDLGRQTATWQTNYAAQVGLPATRTAYDQIGRVVNQVDALGNATATVYSYDGRTIMISYPNGSNLVVTRSADNDIISIKGSAVTPEFHFWGIADDGTRWTRIVRGETSASSRFSKYFTNLLGQLIREERSGFNGGLLAVVNIYDGYGRNVSNTSEYNPSVSYSYDSFGNRETATFSAITGGVSQSNQWRRVESFKRFVLVDGNVWSIETNVVSCSDLSIAPMVSTSACQYSGLTPLIFARRRATDYRGNVIEFTGVKLHACEEMHQSQPWAQNESVVAYRYGVRMQEASVSAVTNLYIYDSLGRLSGRVDGRGGEKAYLYDSRGLRVAVVDALRGRTSYSYDRLGNLTAITDPIGNQDMFEYDLRGRKIYEGGARYPVRYAYDVFGNMISMSTYRNESSRQNAGDVTTWRYDEASGCMTNKVYADGKGVSYDYTIDGKVSRRVWARGITTQYLYDGWHNLTNTIYSDDTPTVSEVYDAMGRRIEVHDAAGVTKFTYDGFASLTNETTIGAAGTNTIIRHWDGFGRATGYSLNGARQTTVSHDQATGRIASMLANGSDTPFTWTYHPGSDWKSSLAYPNGIVASWQYDAKSRLLQVSNTTSTNVISQYDYTYDAAGRRIASVNSGAAFTHADHIDYSYNIRSELTNAMASVDSSYCYAYQYDDVGNRIWALENTNHIEYVANNLNQYEQTSSIRASVRDEFMPEFDDDGNQTLVKTATGIWRVQYNGENRPVLWSNGSTNIIMSYDHLGRRVRCTERHGDDVVSDLSFAYDDYSQILAHSLVHGTSGQTIWDPSEPVASRPLAWNGGDGVFYYLHDGDKNVTGVVNAGMDRQGYYCYAPYGEMQMLNSGDHSAGSWRFSSEWYDEGLGLVYYLYRHFIPDQARWTGRDVSPVPSVNAYAFLGNRFGRIDCYGMYDEWVHYYLMYYMMRRMGYDDKHAKALAEGSAYPDADSLWKFVRFDAIHSLFIFKTIYQKTLHNLNGFESDRLKEYQCCIKKLIKELLGESIEESVDEETLFKVGVLLHALGDTYAHFKPSGKEGDDGRSFPVVAGHAKEGTAPDNPYCNMPRFRAFLDDVMDLIPNDYSGDLAKGVYDAMWPVKLYFPNERYLTYQEMIKMLYKNSYYIKFEEKTVERNSDRDRVVEKLVERLLKCLNPEKE